MADLSVAERFWVDVMGYDVEWRPDDDNVYLTSGSDNLALHRGVGASATDGGGVQRLDHIGLAVPAPADVDAWAAHLGAAGVTLKAAPRTHRDGSRSLYFHAPDGTLVQIIYHRPLSLVRPSPPCPPRPRTDRQSQQAAGVRFSVFGGLRRAGQHVGLRPARVELKNNVKRAWWRTIVYERDDMEGLDAAILMNRLVWKYSGHEATFSDPMTDCRNCKSRPRADHVFMAQKGRDPKGWRRSTPPSPPRS